MRPRVHEREPAASRTLVDLLNSSKASIRKVRLLTCAINARILNVLSEGPVADAVCAAINFAERWVEEEIDLESHSDDRALLIRAYDFRQLRESIAAAIHKLHPSVQVPTWGEYGRSPEYWALLASQLPIQDRRWLPGYGFGNHARAAVVCGTRRAHDPKWRDRQVIERVDNQEATAQLSLARDILGNTSISVAFDPFWRTSTTAGLARAIYEDRAFDRLPILADALEEAGCDGPDVLAHCRDPNGVHVRGCWVVDLVLGKS